MTDEISEIKDYILKEDIGQGNFGKVKLAIYKPTNEEFAIKIINKKMIKIKMKNVIFKENEIITKFNHINVIYVYEIIDTPENYYIVMEYCKRGELFDYIVNHQRIKEDEASVFFYQLINGVEYIHSKGIAHRDLKPENILLTQDKILKIIDFGLSHEFNEEDLLKTKCGSPSYASPEIISHPFYDGFKTDIWCCGIILFAMLCGYLPFDGEDNENNNNTLFKNIIECNIEFPDFVGELGRDLIYKILTVKPEDRITIPEIKRHPFYIKGKTLCKLDYALIEENIIKKRSYKNNLVQEEVEKLKEKEISDENLITKKIFDIESSDNFNNYNEELNKHNNCITIVENSVPTINTNKENQMAYSDNMTILPKDKIGKKINNKLNYNPLNKNNISPIGIKITNIINFNKINRLQMNSNNNQILNTDANKFNHIILSKLKMSKNYNLFDKLINTKINYTKTLEQDKLYTNNYLSTLNKEKNKFNNNFKPAFRDFLKNDKNTLNIKLLGNPKNNRNIFLNKFDKPEIFLDKKNQNTDNKTFNDEIFLRNFRKNLLKKEKLNKEKNQINSNNDFLMKNNTIDIDNKSNRIISLSNENNMMRKSIGINDNSIKLSNIKKLIHNYEETNNTKVKIVSRDKKSKKFENLSSDKYLNYKPKNINKNINCDIDNENSSSFINEKGKKENYIIPIDKQHIYKSENNYKKNGLSLQKTYKKIDDKINLSKLIQNLNQENEHKKSSVKKKNKSFFNRLNLNHKTIESYRISNRNNTIENNRIPVNLTKKMRNYNLEIKLNEIKNINDELESNNFNKNRNLLKIKDTANFKTNKNNILPILTDNNRNIRLNNFKKA